MNEPESNLNPLATCLYVRWWAVLAFFPEYFNYNLYGYQETLTIQGVCQKNSKPRGIEPSLRTRGNALNPIYCVPVKDKRNHLKMSQRKKFTTSQLGNLAFVEFKKTSRRRLMQNWINDKIFWGSTLPELDGIVQ